MLAVPKLTVPKMIRQSQKWMIGIALIADRDWKCEIGECAGCPGKAANGLAAAGSNYFERFAAVVGHECETAGMVLAI